MAKDYYKALGIDRGANKEEIKKAYKTLVKQYHPDLNPNVKDKEKIKEINEAYSVLSDESKRANYDRFGEGGEQFSSGFGGFEGGFNDFGGFEDIFDSMFEGFGFGGRRRTRAMRGEDLHYTMEVSFKDAFFGASRKIESSRYESCEKCKGTGAKNGRMNTCPECSGTGRKQRTIRTPFGIMSQTTACPLCKGKGQAAEETCNECKGKGRVKRTRAIDVKIPAGVYSGATLKLRGEGEVGANGGPAGDLYIELEVAPDKVFEREDNDIKVSLPISFAQAALGDEIKVPTMEGGVNVKIPAGTQTNTIFRLKGKGFVDVNGGPKGDEHIQVVVYTPSKLSKREKELLEELKSVSKPITEKSSFFSKMKGVFQN